MQSPYSIFGGHDTCLKTFMKIYSSYYWPGLYQDIKLQVQTCLTCQQRKRATTKPTPLQPLPISDRPNWRIHANLFGPMLTADSNKKFVLCIMDAFTKYAVVTSIQNKNAETVANAIFKEWFCKFGIPAQIHTDGGKEFVKKLSAEMMELMNVSHTRTSPAHPQCNSQVEVFNKTIKKYLASFVDDTALNWETFLPALALSYNTSYHSTIVTTPFELLFGKKHGSYHFQTKTFKKCTMEKPLMQKDLICYKDSEKSHIKMPQQMGKRQKNNMTKK